MKKVLAAGIAIARQASALFDAITGPLAATLVPPPEAPVDEAVLVVLVVLVGLVVLVLAVLVVLLALAGVVGVDADEASVLAGVLGLLVDAAAEVPLSDEALLELPQALSANPVEKITKCRPALSACDLKAIVTYSYKSSCESAEGERQSPEFTKTLIAVFGNPAICIPQTGSFASPAYAGFALERPAVNHARIAQALCRNTQTTKEILVTKM